MVGKEGTDSSFPIDTLTLTLTFHDPEQSLIYQLHLLDTSIIVGLHTPPRTILLHGIAYVSFNVFSRGPLREVALEKKATSASSEVLHSVIHPTSCVALHIFVSFSLQ